VAHSVLRVNEPTDVEFLGSSSGSLRVWLNGKSVHVRAEPQSFRIDSDRFAATLAKGDNRLAVMVAGSAAPVEFHLRLRRKSATAQHERLIQAALARPGNVERGRQAFLNVEKSQCLKCHRVGEQGERTGPELTGIGARFSRIYIVESILEPSRTIAPSFGTITVLLQDGRTLSGVKTAETEAEFTLVDNQGQKHLVLKAEIEEQKTSSQSTMPDGLEKRLTDQEFVDLIAYFASLKESRAP
jgi:putative heme-binding domain-containing protein